MGFFIGPLYPIINAHQLYSLPNEQERGTLLGLIIIFSSLASCTSSLVIGLTLDHIQPEYAFTLLFLPTIALSALFLNYKQKPIS
jgi:MFS family permease